MSPSIYTNHNHLLLSNPLLQETMVWVSNQSGLDANVSITKLLNPGGSAANYVVPANLPDAWARNRWGRSKGPETATVTLNGRSYNLTVQPMDYVIIHTDALIVLPSTAVRGNRYPSQPFTEECSFTASTLLTHHHAECHIYLYIFVLWPTIVRQVTRCCEDTTHRQQWCMLCCEVLLW